jgi:hypothetical protein
VANLGTLSEVTFIFAQFTAFSFVVCLKQIQVVMFKLNYFLILDENKCVVGKRQDFLTG